MAITRKKEEEVRTQAQIIEEYVIGVDDIPTKIQIIKRPKKNLLYRVSIEEISAPTKALLAEVRHRLITEISISAAEILNPKAIENLKERFKEHAERVISEVLPSIDNRTKTFLIGRLLHNIIGLGKLEYLLGDGQLEEIVINSSEEPIFVYHKKYGWLETNVIIRSEEQINNFANTIARRIGRQITTLNPLLDAHLITGDRANAVLYPISTKGNTITIRKFARDPWTITDLITNNTCTPELFALIWTAIQYEMNILIAGGTASGKTTMLNVCMSFMPPNQRVLSIEDTRELTLPKYLYWCPLTIRQPNPEGKGQVTMLDLLVNSLRMRPDRIIVGEIRRKRQAEVLFEAMHTGHSVYSTVHADSMGETIRRLINPPIDVPPNLLSAINLTLVMFRDRRRGIRRVYQVGEILTGEEQQNIAVRPNIMYRWNPTTDKIIPHSTSLRFFEELGRHTGLTQKEINSDLEARARTIIWVVKNNIRALDDVGKILHEYYLDQDRVFDLARKNTDPRTLLK